MLSETVKNLFTEKECEVIEKCVEAEDYTSISSALASIPAFEFTPEKEKALDEFLKGIRPVEFIEDESEVRKELQAKFAAGYRIESPEEERDWQARIDAETEAKKAKMIEETKAEEVSTSAADSVVGASNDSQAPASSADVLPADDPLEIDLTKTEVMDELKKLNVPFKPAQSKADLVSLLEASMAKV